MDGVDNDDWEDIAVNIEVAILRDNLTSIIKCENEKHIYTINRRERASYMFQTPATTTMTSKKSDFFKK